MTIKVLGVGSSMREGSFSTAALNIALGFSKHQGAETNLLDLRKTQLPMFYSQEQKTREIQEVTNHVKWADAFLLATPDYHGSMSGSMKNFLDYFWSDFAGKLFGYMCASHEKGLTVMDQMRTAVRQCYGWSLPYGVSLNGEEDFENNQITNQKLKSRLEMLSGDLVTYGELLRGQFLKDLKGNSSNTFASHYRK
ncbi:MAG: NAD(P)H-dependent oxidoreductase [Nitrosopumilaceae archaeon]